MSKEANWNWTYEEAIKRLEDTVQRLEEGELNLEDSLASFEEAVGLVHYCQKVLNRAEKRLAVLLEDEDGEFKIENLSFSGD